MAKIQGDVEIMSLSEVVSLIATKNMNCTLESHRFGMKYRYSIRQGLLVQASSNDSREYLGQHLINFGHLNEEDLEKAFVTQKETHVPLGEVLVLVDTLSQKQLDRVLAFKIRESILESIHANYGEFLILDEVSSPPTMDSQYCIDLQEVLSEAQARSQMWTEIRKVFPTDAVQCWVHPIGDVPDISSFDRQLLKILAAGKTIGEACLELRSMDFQVYARLYDLSNRNLIRTKKHDELAKNLKDPLFDAQQSRSEESLEAKLDAAILHSKEEDLKEKRSEKQNILSAEDYQQLETGVFFKNSLHAEIAEQNWSEVILVADRILERDRQNAEAIAARRVAEVQLQKQKSQSQFHINLEMIPEILVDKKEMAFEILSSKERYVYTRIDGIRTLSQIASVCPVQEEDLLRIVMSFVKKEHIRLRSR